MVEFISDEIPHWADMPASHPYGLSGGQFDDLVVASPNAKVVYAPMYGQVRNLQLCEDYRWGTEDYINLPQPYSSINNHILCCPAPTYIHEDTKHLFRAFEDKDWIPIANHGVDGLGHIDRVLHCNLKAKTKDTLTKIMEISEDKKNGRLDDFDGRGLVRFVSCAWALRRDLDGVGYTKTKHQVKMQYVDILRRDMELRGFIDYVRIYRPRMHNIPTKPVAVDPNRMGCFTNSFTIADRLHHCGLPVWYVYKASAPGHDPMRFRKFLTVDEVQSLRNADGIPARHLQMASDSYMLMARRPAPNATVLWTGSPEHGDQYRVMGTVLNRTQSPFEKLQLISSGTSTIVPFPLLPATESSDSTTASGM